MNLFVAGLSYRTASVELREQVAVPLPGLLDTAQRLKTAAGLDEVVLVSTCNRVEIYGVASGRRADAGTLFSPLGGPSVEVGAHVYLHEDDDALRHLFAVTSGLDSMVLGETEITGQVKHAYEIARQGGLTGAVLNRAFQAAFQAAKEVRTRTAVGRGATSVGSVAVEVARRVFDDRLDAQTVLIIGAGKMGEACLRHLAKHGSRTVLVANRSPERAQRLAAEFGGQALGMEDLPRALAKADIVISSTGSPLTILCRRDLEAILPLRAQRPLVIIDIAVPRDVDPDVNRLDHVFLYDIDDLEAVVRENLRHREQELALCHTLIADRTAAVMAKIKPVRGRIHDPGVQPELGRVLCGVAAGSR